jgi:hypothetical protein
MPWIKRNLYWVVGGVVALGLLGGAFYYLYSSLQAEKQIDEQLNAKQALKDQLQNANPHPGTGEVDNVAEAKKDEARVKEFLTQMKHSFVPISAPAVSDTYEFKLLLDSTQAELERKAERSGVVLPPRPYSFTFDAPKKSATLDPGALQPLAQQLAEVKTVCEILFDAKVHSLESVRRVAVSRVDIGADYLPKKAATNSLAILAPYEVIFKGFSSELAAVLNGLAQSPHCFIVRTLNTEVTTPTVISSDAGQGGPIYHQPMPGQPPGAGHDPFRSRYGVTRSQVGSGGESGSQEQISAMMRRRYANPYGGGAAPEAAPTATFVPAAPKAGPTNVIVGKPLRVSLLLDAVRLKSTK